MDKVLFWLDADLTSFCLAYYLQKKIDAEFYAIIDITNRPKKFFMNQKLITFKKIWFYHDHVLKNTRDNVTYPENFGLNANELVKNDRIFNPKYNEFHIFSKNEINSILSNELSLFNEVLNINPTIFVTTETALRPHHTFYLLCKKKGIKVLMLNLANWGNYCYISENYHRIDNFEEIFKNKKSLSTTFNDLKNRLESKIVSKKLTKFYQSQKKSQLEKIKAAFQLLILSDNSNEKTHYTYYGRKKLKVLFKEIQYSLKRRYREKYINKNFLQQIPNDLSFIFLPLQQEPERSLLISAPDYVNQIKTVEYVSKHIPKNYLLFVKEHPTQGPGRGWRKISDYQAMQNNPKVKLIHPSVPANEIIAKSKLVISVSGTLALESAFFNKPSITFADNDYTLIPSISKLESKNELCQVIEDSLEKKVDPNYVGKYFDILEENSFIFDYLGFQISYLKHFYFDGNLVDVEIDESEMLKFLLDHEKSFSVLIERFKQKINNYKKN